METYHGWGNVPPNLKTKTSLKKEGLRLKRGQQHVAWVYTRYGSKRNDYKLYDVNECVPAKPPTEKQLAAIEKAKAASLAARTCTKCGYVEELSRNYRNKYRVTNGLCEDCHKQIEIEDDGREASEWASKALADPMAIILDTETTGLDGEIIELAIINMQGEALFNKRFKPFTDVEEGAIAVHGITTEMLADESDFCDHEKTLRSILCKASRVIIYNRSFDENRLYSTCNLHDVETFDFKAECAMLMYAQWIGDWSNYWGNYKWYPLSGGDHSALGDCLATLECLKEMARDNAEIEASV